MSALAEDLLLLLLDDESGRPVVDGTAVDLALGGAQFVDAVAAGRVAPSDGDRFGVRDGSPTGDTVLDAAVRRLTSKSPFTAQRAVELLVKGTRDALLERLADAGEVRREQHRVLGVFPRTSWPAAAGEREARVRARLAEALTGGRAPDPHVAALIVLLDAIGALPKVVPGDPKALAARATEIGEGDGVGEAVRKALRDVRAAMYAAIAAGGVSAAVTGGFAGST
jgi:hypothetical protein